MRNKVKYDHFRVNEKKTLTLNYIIYIIKSKPLHEALFILTAGLLSGCCFIIAAHECIEDQEKFHNMSTITFRYSCFSEILNCNKTLKVLC